MSLNLFNRARRSASGPTEFYQRPHTYRIAVGTDRVCVAPGRQHSPAITLLIQADLANTGIISLGDSNVSNTVGIQLDSGKAALFAPQMNPSNQPGTLGTGIDSYTESAPYATEAAITQAMGGTLGQGVPIRILLDISDFFVIADHADQGLRIFWVESVRLP